VFGRVHGARIYVEIRVDLHEVHFEAACGEDFADEAEAMPLPTPDITPPITNINLRFFLPCASRMYYEAHYTMAIFKCSAVDYGELSSHSNDDKKRLDRNRLRWDSEVLANQ
jgi:hypothetical protein